MNHFYKNMHDKYIQVIASHMHYEECLNNTVATQATYAEIKEATDGWEMRYKTDPVFRARVQCLVAVLMTEFARDVNEYIKFKFGDTVEGKCEY